LKDNNQLADEKEVLYKKSASSSPINNNGIIARINSLNNRTTYNKTYAGYNQNQKSNFSSIDYSELLQSFNEVLKNKTNVNDFFYSVHNILANKLNCFFTAFGSYHTQSNYINLKLIDKIGGTYSSRIFSSETTNPIIECFNNKCSTVKMDSKFLNIPYLQNSPVAIIPLISVNNTIGVMLVGDNNAKNNIDLFNVVSNHLALFMHNFELLEKVSANSNIDSLTLLNNHRGFQEILSWEHA